MSKREPCGSAIYLHRRLTLPCFPAAEAGPAAIMSKSSELLLSLACRAGGIERGEHDSCIGGREGVCQRVRILSPLVPGIGDLADRLDWQFWDGGAFPTLTADVIIVCRPLELVRGLRFEEAARHLVEMAFGGGAVYSTVDTLALLDAHGDRQERQLRRTR